MNEERNDLQKMITQALEEIKESEGESYDLSTVNLALVSRETGLIHSCWSWNRHGSKTSTLRW